MESTYEPKKYEAEIYQRWQASGFFNPDNLPRHKAGLTGKRKKKYVIMMPPPNITGSLHMGHMLDNTIPDILIRYHRMRGDKTLWLPGTDHAGIATQNVVEKELAKQGLRRQELGREKFIERVWQWREKYGNQILEQLKRLGCSCDWSRTRFTMDADYSKAVQTAFIHYWQKGYVYRGPRLVNWCPRCSTAISDIEVKHREEKSRLFYIRYLEPRIKDQYIVVATTRPETMLGDTAVAVNPKDERYKNLIGQRLILPIVNREIPIIAHRLVDPEFGTGAVKVTPAHDAMDWKIGKENNLEIINVIGPDAKMTKEAGKYAGLVVLEARRRIVEELKSLVLLEKEEDYVHQTSVCDRCGTVIEPQISTQWFVRMDKLAKPAIEAIRKNKIRSLPERYKKIYLDWMEKIEDWCISRQLWWGHQLPVWFCQNGDLKPKTKNQKPITECFVVSAERPQKCGQCGAIGFKQSEDVLDTWFSSALWPFATLGWPNVCAQKSKIKNQKFCKPLRGSDLEKFFPTSFVTTAQEILYLWEARMIFSSLEFTRKIPFEVFYIHSTIFNVEGRRMSKSLGTGVEPLGLIDQYGADAVRFGIILQTNRDQQAIKFDERSIVAARNFINKIWNISRFVEMQRDTNLRIHPNATNVTKVKPATLADRWIMSRTNAVIDSISQKIENYEFGEAAKEIYEFVWHEFADWYLEISKIQMTEKRLKENTVSIIRNSLFIILKLLHPFVPFVTEETYQQLGLGGGDGLLMISDWPKADKRFIDKKAEKEIKNIQEIVVKIRNKKAEQKTPLNQVIDYKLTEKNVDWQKDLIEKFAKVKIQND